MERMRLNHICKKKTKQNKPRTTNQPQTIFKYQLLLQIVSSVLYCCDIYQKSDFLSNDTCIPCEGSLILLV